MVVADDPAAAAPKRLAGTGPTNAHSRSAASHAIVVFYDDQVGRG